MCRPLIHSGRDLRLGEGLARGASPRTRCCSATGRATRWKGQRHPPRNMGPSRAKAERRATPARPKRNHLQGQARAGKVGVTNTLGCKSHGRGIEFAIGAVAWVPSPFVLGALIPALLRIGDIAGSRPRNPLRRGGSGPQGMGLSSINNEILECPVRAWGWPSFFLIAGLEINSRAVRARRHGLRCAAAVSCRWRSGGWAWAFGEGKALGLFSGRRLHRIRHRGRTANRRVDAIPQGCRPACAALWPLRPRFGGGGRGAAAVALALVLAGVAGFGTQSVVAGLFRGGGGCLRSRLPDASATPVAAALHARR